MLQKNYTYTVYSAAACLFNLFVLRVPAHGALVSCVAFV